MRVAEIDHRAAPGAAIEGVGEVEQVGDVVRVAERAHGVHGEEHAEPVGGGRRGWQGGEGEGELVAEDLLALIVVHRLIARERGALIALGRAPQELDRSGQVRRVQLVAPDLDPVRDLVGGRRGAARRQLARDPEVGDLFRREDGGGLGAEAPAWDHRSSVSGRDERDVQLEIVDLVGEAVFNAKLQPDALPAGDRQTTLRRAVDRAARLKDLDVGSIVVPFGRRQAEQQDRQSGRDHLHRSIVRPWRRIRGG